MNYILNRNRIKTTDRGVTDPNLISDVQVFSPAIRLIPFLGHNDPTRNINSS